MKTHFSDISSQNIENQQITSVKYSVIMLSVRENERGHVEQWVTCLTTDGSLTADSGVASLIPAQSLTFEEIDH